MNFLRSVNKIGIWKSEFVTKTQISFHLSFKKAQYYKIKINPKNKGIEFCHKLWFSYHYIFRYFKLWILVNQIISVGNMKGANHQFAILLRLKNMFLWQRPNTFLKGTGKKKWKGGYRIKPENFRFWTIPKRHLSYVSVSRNKHKTVSKLYQNEYMPDFV